MRKEFSDDPEAEDLNWAGEACPEKLENLSSNEGISGFLELSQSFIQAPLGPTLNLALSTECSLKSNLQFWQY